MTYKKSYELDDDALDQVIGGVASVYSTVPGSNMSSVVAGGNTQSYVTPTGIAGFTPVNSNVDLNDAATADSTVDMNLASKQLK